MKSSIPRRFPAASLDGWVYLSRHLQHQHGNFVLDFAGRLDEHRLQRAVRIAMDAEPVFGCRYVPGRKACFERRKDLDSLTLCTVVESGDPEAELQRFVEVSSDGTQEPLLLARIVRGENDLLLLKTNHLAGDGQACKWILSRIASFYREVGPFTPNLGCRGTRQLFREIGARECLRLLRGPISKRAGDEWRFPSGDRANQGELRCALRRLDASAFDRMQAYGRRFGATLNDVFLAAYFRALWRFLDFPAGIPQSIVVPIDMRRYLRSPAAQAVSNFTSTGDITLERIPDESFEGTLSRVKQCTLTPEGRRDHALAVMLWKILLYRFSFAKVDRDIQAASQKNLAEGRSIIGFTNMGAFEPERFDFGVPLVEIYRMSQAVVAPGLLLSVSSFQKRLTFAIEYPSRAIRQKDIERFLDTFVDEMLEPIGSEAIERSLCTL